MYLSNWLLFSWKNSYLTSVPKLVVTLSQSVVTTSVLLVRSGRSLMLQFTAVKGSTISSKSFSRKRKILTVAGLWHQIIPFPVKPIVSPRFACYLPLLLKGCWSDLVKVRVMLNNFYFLVTKSAQELRGWLATQIFHFFHRTKTTFSRQKVT